jgi:PAS domain S-box-containing protein
MMKDRFRELIEGLNVITYEFDLKKHRFTYISRMAESILGYPSSDWFEEYFWYKHLHQNDREWAPAFSKENVRMLKDHEFEYRMIASNGSVKWFKDIVTMVAENGAAISLHGVLIDMTERKETENELRESKERYKALVEQQSEMITRWKSDGTYTYVNDVFCNFFGKKREELLGRTYIPEMPIEDMEVFSRFILQLNASNPVGQFTHRVIRPDGEIRWLLWTDTAIVDKNGNITEYQTVGRDITDRKRAEEALKDSENQLQLIFENAPIGMAITDFSKKYIKVNKAYCDIVGYTKKELLNMTYEEITYPDDKYIDENLFNFTGSSRKKHLHFEKRYVHRSGKIVYVEIRIQVLKDSAGKPFQQIAQVVDITERKEAGLKLKQTQTRLSGILNNLPNVTIYEFGEDINFVSENIMDILGYPADAFMQNASFFSDLMLDEDIIKYDNKVAEWKMNGGLGVLSNEIRVRNKDNEIVWLEDHMFEVMPENGKPYYSGIMIDITRQKETQEKIRETETKLAAILNNLPNVVVYQSGSKKDFISENIFEMTGYTPQEILKEKYFFGDVIHPDDLPAVKNALKDWHKRNDEGIMLMEFRMKRSNGTYIWLEDHMFKIHDEISGQYLSGILIDVTERKLAEQSLSRSLKEKELMLKEIHHRVKNNLQIVSSLLKLQTEYVKDENALDLLIDSQNRVKSMALVHQKLYQSADFSEIDFTEYLTQLSGHLLNSFKTNPDNVSIDIISDRLVLGIDHAVPCGLILNELISNSLKYAFPSGRNGIIKVELKSDDDHIDLVISDNGIGFPKNIDYRNTQSLGMQLVNTLVGQIEGTIKMENQTGTMFHIRFKNKSA